MPQLKAWQAGGAFADPVAVPDDAPAGARLIAITGRTP
jgi:hypothetical protein